MPVRKPKPTSPGLRFVSYPDFAEITKTTPEKSLTEKEAFGEGGALIRDDSFVAQNHQLARLAAARDILTSCITSGVTAADERLFLGPDGKPLVEGKKVRGGLGWGGGGRSKGKGRGEGARERES